MNQRPNLLFILTDDQGAWAMRCAGNTDIHTPNLDRLAAGGTRFENFFCASPVCSPARASILTGRIPSQHGVHDWIRSGSLDKKALGQNADHPYFASEDVPIRYLEGLTAYPDLLAQQGYTCALSGKWCASPASVVSTFFVRAVATDGAVLRARLCGCSPRFSCRSDRKSYRSDSFNGDCTCFLQRFGPLSGGGVALSGGYTKMCNKCSFFLRFCSKSI